MKNKLSILALSWLCFSSYGAFASTADDLAMIRPLIPSGYDIAQAQLLQLKGMNASVIESAVSTNYLLRDFNGDGVQDVMMIIEKNPTLENFDKKAPCDRYDWNNGCSIVYGERILQVYLGLKDGGYKLFVSNEKIVLNGDDGGAFGDPLNGLAATKKGSVRLEVYGGSSWRWRHVDTIQYRGDDFYIVGQTDSGLHTAEPETTSSFKDVNLITGEMISYEHSSHNAAKTKIPVKPLVKLRNFVSPLKQ